MVAPPTCIPTKSVEKQSEVAQSCPTLCDPMDGSLPGSSLHGIFQARILEWVAISFSRRFSPPRDRTRVSRIVDRCFTVWATREVSTVWKGSFFSILSPAFNVCGLFDDGQSDQCEVIPHCSFVYSLASKALCENLLERLSIFLLCSTI